ncbi:MAG: hypothetical protein JWN34_2945 [Bryobacterales bacterium]|nr:hypothetical protein [Bryobacterales bacterium]
MCWFSDARSIPGVQNARRARVQWCPVANAYQCRPTGSDLPKWFSDSLRHFTVNQEFEQGRVTIQPAPSMTFSGPTFCQR